MFRLVILLALILLNVFSVFALMRAVRIWVSLLKRQRAVLWCVAVIVALMNVPFILLFNRTFDSSLLEMPLWSLQMIFYPTMVWLATITIFFIIAGPTNLIAAALKALSGLISRSRGMRRHGGAPGTATTAQAGLSRRQFVVGGTGILLPCIYGAAACCVSGNFDQLDISKEQVIGIPHLPKHFEGMTIVQLSDLHVGPYLRERELRHIVGRTNELRPDLVVITGDIVDRHLDSLPDVTRGLAGIRSSLGAFAVLGNHDISSDRYGVSADCRGGIHIARGLESIGIRTLRNEVVCLGSPQDRIALLGLEWLSYSPNSRDFRAYQQTPTRQHLQRMTADAGPETPCILLAHHPDTFVDAATYGIGLTLAGHTHGGGQVILGSIDGLPIGLGMFQFRYLSGLYQEQRCSLYVNRGIGYGGIPIRLNCPPEISRFKLVGV